MVSLVFAGGRKSGRIIQKIGGTDWGEALCIRQRSDGLIHVGGTFDFTTGHQLDPGTDNVFALCHFRPTLHRYTSTGQLVESFGAGGVAQIGMPESVADCELTDFVHLADGRIFCGIIHYDVDSGVYQFGVAMFTNSGVLDAGFGTDGVKFMDAQGGSYFQQVRVAQRSDGILVAASTRVVQEVGRPTIYWMNPTTGAAETAFGNNKPLGRFEASFPGVDARIYSLLVDSQDRVLVGGYYQEGEDHQSMLVIRLTDDGGEEDAIWGTDGVVRVDFPQQLGAVAGGGLIEQADHKIIAVGTAAYDASNHSAIALCRLEDADGALDTGFGSSGFVRTHGGTQTNDDSGQSSAFLDGTKIVVIGASNSVGSNYYTATQQAMAARYTSAGVPDTTFSGDGFLVFDVNGSDNEPNYGNFLALDGNYLFSGHTNGADGPTGGAFGSVGKRLATTGAAYNTFGQAASFTWGTSPSVTTGAATSVGTTTATANATINPQGNLTSWRFQYGKTTGRYTAQTNVAVVGSGSSGVGVTASLTGLTGSTTYYGRAVAWSANGGPQFGDEITFTTS